MSCSEEDETRVTVGTSEEVLREGCTGDAISHSNQRPYSREMMHSALNL